MIFVKLFLFRLIVPAALVVLLFNTFLAAQSAPDSFTSVKDNALKIYIDCDDCDEDYFRTEITFVNFVRDRLQADVHLQITTQRTGGSGTEYTITFKGQQKFSGVDDTLKFVARDSDTEDDIRTDQVGIIKLGLIRYVSHTDFAEHISITHSKSVEPVEVNDKWKNWVFTLSGNGYFNGEESYNFRNLWGSFSAGRVTEATKLNIGIFGSHNRDRFATSQGEISSSSSSRSAEISVVFSLTNHWSYGFETGISSSTYSNRDFTSTTSVAIEYNIFPYSESTRKQLRLAYGLRHRYDDYTEETIYDKTTENRYLEELSATLEVVLPWGSISTTLEGTHYFHDFKKYRLEFSSNLSLRVFQGLSVNLNGSYSEIHDQLSLPKEGASEEEILLRRSQLATSYSYWTSVGLSYTFGSIYNDIVNPRFGD